MNGSCCKNDNRARNLLLSLLAMMLLVSVVLYLCLAAGDSRITGKVDDNQTLKLIIDEDGGADDAMAISMALLNEKYFKGPEVVAITTLHGNVLENQTYINTQKILNANDRLEVKIYRGASRALLKRYESDQYFGVDGLGDLPDTFYESVPAQDEIAAMALIKYSKLYEGRLIVCTIGALTNIALAIRLDPGFLGRLAQLYVAGGYIQDDKYIEPEFNILMDVEAYKIVVDAATVDKVTMIPFSGVMESLNITNDWRINTLGKIQTQLMQTHNRWEHVAWEKTSYWSFLDAAAIGIIIDENLLIEKVNSKNDVGLNGDNRGLNTNDFNATDEYNVKIATKFNITNYKELLYRLFSADLNCKKIQ